ncbi:bifunctional (p)ppGpp synthetase/guanosine-3',5'-bis(diphosphate) 3'-pyrophosphohydrolase [Schaalia sp. ZJ405]|uniref:RelA/SpoT family protein n=1 Tax=unclassified Schaalia TaxID=2691889 RepID=UPI0018C9112B|nr:MULTISPECIES: bifunctional (p)ppGpp synthetase/guanosine-3',5'-bis(diphosphate) 3'-pyrophosphohydrolase [unclassified Schaalia]QPK80517.1 bifunctional (p)ppGpp synthetase/guanosine-3',5'-bis(diphosphate) 3'-pyrophosphohydrolase [Schaalia sp. ZJ405]
MTDQNAAATNRPPAAGSFVRSGLLWFGAKSRQSIPEIEPLIRALRANHPRADITVIERAYRTAELYHRGQQRKSGEPYITHPVAVATILAEMGMTTPTLVAALLHDTVEDTDYTVEKLTAEYGESIAALVDGVTKLDKVRYGASAQSETLRKMLVAMSRDIRVLLIKLADRLHNARTWRFVPAESARKKAQETLEIYSPLAHRLGMNMIKWELEELSFKTLYPEIYTEIDHLVAERAPQREEYLHQVISQIEQDLRHSGTKGTVTGRPKNHYSIYQKMIVRGKAFDEIFDLVAVRVLVDSVKDCYAVLGALHGRWNPIPGRFKDYIAMPKFNLYQSLHTTVVGPGGKPVEIQIRTFEMHERAEHGVAAHWKYKQNPNATSADGDEMTKDEQANWLRTLVEMERETGDPEEFLDSLRFEIAGDEVYVFTPRGEIVVLPARATPVDFAYAVHTEVGHRTVGAKVNGRLVSLDTRLESGETVEVVTSKSDKAGPSRDWLSFVASPRARTKIKAWFSRERREEAVEAGKEQIARVMRKQNLPLQRLMSHESVLSVANSLGYLDVTGLYAAVGESQISPQNVVTKLVDILGGGDGTEETLSEAVMPGASRPRSPHVGDVGVTVSGMNDHDIWVKLARCCTPVPGDDIVGFITRGQGVSIHRKTCQNGIRLSQLQPERFVDVMWSSDRRGVPFRVQIEIRALDRSGLLSDLTRVLSDYRVNIHAASTQATSDQVAIGRFTFELADIAHLDAVLAALRRVDGVFEALRITGESRKELAHGAHDVR